MKITVIGATGMIGSRVVAEAARRGHEVTAVSRSGDSLVRAGLVRQERTGRISRCRLDAGPLGLALSYPDAFAECSRVLERSQ